MTPDAIRIASSRARDAEGIHDLLVASDLPPDGLEALAGSTLVARAKQEVVGCAALELYGRVALLRSVAVRKELRGCGLGIRLVDAMLARARSAGVQELYLLTLTAQDWFPRFGFETIPRDKAPDPIRQSEEFTTLCPGTAELMRAVLAPG